MCHALYSVLQYWLTVSFFQPKLFIVFVRKFIEMHFMCHRRINNNEEIEQFLQFQIQLNFIVPDEQALFCSLNSCVDSIRFDSSRIHCTHLLWPVTHSMFLLFVALFTDEWFTQFWILFSMTNYYEWLWVIMSKHACL